MAPVVTMKQLLEAGVHFGHQTRRWNPKMKRFIFGERNGIYIIDLQQTLQRIETAYTYVRDLVADGGTILFIGTKKQAQDPISQAADGCGMPYINERWLGGMLTNFSTISSRVKKMQEYQRMRAAGDFEAMPKKEALLISRELEKLERNLGGIRNMTKLPDAVFIIDTKKEHIGVVEANKLKLPVVAVVDTNCDPDLIDYVIPGNDDAIRSGTLMCRIISDAVKEGRHMGERRGTVKVAPAAPSPEEEAERARQQAEARAAAARQAAEREARIAASAQSSPLTEVPLHSADPAQADVAPPPSEVLEPNPGAVPARDNDAEVAARFPGTQPGAAADAPPGSHLSRDTGEDVVGPEVAGTEVGPQGRAAGAGETSGATGGDDAGVDPSHPKTDDPSPSAEGE
jgi:small subunit ribosomal protein S2